LRTGHALWKGACSRRTSGSGEEKGTGGIRRKSKTITLNALKREGDTVVSLARISNVPARDVVSKKMSR